MRMTSMLRQARLDKHVAIGKTTGKTTMGFDTLTRGRI